MADLAHPATAFGLGMALGAAPGPVQVLLLGEAARGGLRRGLAAMAGANGTFGLLLLILAAGLTVARPTGTVLRALQIAGGAVLLWIAASSVRETLRTDGEREAVPTRLPPQVRGILAVVINPGAWIFLATSASALLAGAAESGGRVFSFLTAAAMLVGVMIVDASMVVLGASSGRFLGRRGELLLGLALTGALAAIGVWLLFQGATD
ncbi:MAG: LysE family translocator [Actinomycetota bacterium]